ncbi:hypothetical protein [Sporomusa acidovorans]|uniref:Transporter n=1 Tax=Sporomusa acidovorans (strain ATCC 49682 / DSM 3132 / Mol) TaxID=1123286 RepID=A0ABZ3IZ38_SPOA4|nr:hypothetical protein [Sporomusa acidovorans]OZC22097.1 hypothetical protein SPACI_16170 [Sporomusa acidovorans DSM 3132]SDF66372.1 hypothetical protein SAMN04488499_106624 [Sporomusa acidovorans]
MGLELTALHYVYVLFVFLILGVMVKRRDTSLLCIVGIFVIGFMVTGSIYQAISGIFNSFVYAATELMDTILIISIIVAMSKVLYVTGINAAMVAPITKLICTPSQAYWITGLVMLIMSWFFWPSPSVALVGAVLFPVAVKAGLPPLGVAMAMNLFGHGIALSGDFVIQGAPKLTAAAAGIPVKSVVSASVPLVFVMGLVTTVTAYWLLIRQMRQENMAGNQTTGADGDKYLIEKDEENTVLFAALSVTVKNIFAMAVPILFFIDVIIMYTTGLQGGDATALIGGTAVFILALIALVAHKQQGLEKITAYFIDGFKFGFTVFGPVIPIAAFFYLGDSGITHIMGEILPAGSQGLVNDVGLAIARVVPVNAGVSAITLTVVGAVTGLDGSGFSGISLAGSIARLFAAAIGSGIATLTALGQIAAIWVGGGTLIPWALLPAAAICGVNPFDLARQNLVPVLCGLITTTIVAMFLI